jgi:hypothetical protein
MKEIIDEVKKNNGSQMLSNKDLLFYLVGKIDKIDVKLDTSISKVHKRVDENIKYFNIELNKKLDKRSFFTMVGGVLTLVIGSIVGSFKFLYSLINK